MATLTAARPADLQISRLTATNYKIWSELIVEALDGRGVWGYTQGLVDEPTKENESQLQI